MIKQKIAFVRNKKWLKLEIVAFSLLVIFSLTTIFQETLIRWNEKDIKSVSASGDSNNIDTTPPSILSGSPSGAQLSNTTFDLQVSTDEISTCKYSTIDTDYSSMTQFSSTGSTSHSQLFTTMSNNTNYTYFVRCEDNFGNQNVSSYQINFSLGDTTPPSISSGSPSGVQYSGTTQVDLQVNTDEGATCKYSTIDTDYSSMNQFGFTGSTSHSQQISGLSDGNSYTYFVRCEESIGNQNTSSYQINFSVPLPPSAPDNDAPALSFGSPSTAQPSGTTGVTLSLTTDETATCKYSTTPNTAYASITNTFIATASTSHSQSITGLSDGTSYTYYVRCIDTVTNANTTDYEIAFSVDAATVVSEKPVVEEDTSRKSGSNISTATLRSLASPVSRAVSSITNLFGKFLDTIQNNPKDEDQIKDLIERLK